ncbi:MAG TPA: serine/threonine-protein kinase, partial [Gemmatimonadales bacterium]|nr:serine/threonine-protein kinase [Gemmatimonadales bacterium]
MEREIGRGGMGVVYLARDLRHDRDVAVKLFEVAEGGSEGADRFLQEIQIAARLSHPNILPLHDSGEDRGLLFYVMPYVPGENLGQRLEREGALPVADALTLAGEIAGALAYAHSHGVIHRDIKPANVLFISGHAVVADFGIARAISAGGWDESRLGDDRRGGGALLGRQQAHQCVAQLLGGLVAVGRVLGQRLPHDGLQALGEGGPAGLHRQRLRLQMLEHQIFRGGAAEGRVARQHLVQHAAEAVDVAAAVHPGAAPGLLRAHVGRRAGGHPRQAALVPAAG